MADAPKHAMGFSAYRTYLAYQGPLAGVLAGRVWAGPGSS